MTLTFLILLPLIGVVGLALAFIMFRRVRRWLPPDPLFAGISSEIRRSLVIFLSRAALVLAPLLLLILLALSRWATPGTTWRRSCAPMKKAGSTAKGSPR